MTNHNFYRVANLKYRKLFLHNEVYCGGHLDNDMGEDAETEELEGNLVAQTQPAATPGAPRRPRRPRPKCAVGVC